MIVKERDLNEISKRQQHRPLWPTTSLLHIGFFEGKGIVKLVRRLPKEAKTFAARLDSKTLRVQPLYRNNDQSKENREQFEQQLIREWRESANQS